MQWYFYVGLIASICIAIYMMPQLIKTIKTKDTAGISIIMLTLSVIGGLFFVINGIGIMADKKTIADTAKRVATGLPIFLANLFSFAISTVTAIIKGRNMYRAKKLNISEKTFCTNYKDSVALYNRNFGKNKNKPVTADPVQ